MLELEDHLAQQVIEMVTLRAEAQRLRAQASKATDDAIALEKKFADAASRTWLKAELAKHSITVTLPDGTLATLAASPGTQPPKVIVSEQLKKPRSRKRLPIEDRKSSAKGKKGRSKK